MIKICDMIKPIKVLYFRLTSIRYRGKLTFVYDIDSYWLKGITLKNFILERSALQHSG